jgi:hypothetical protein
LPDLARKLLLKPGYRVLTLNAPPEVQHRLAAADLSTESTPSGHGYDAVILFANTRSAAEKDVSVMISQVRPGMLAWLAYRKVPRSDLNRPGVWEVVEPIGWVPVSQVAIDSSWSAMRLRRRSEIGTPTGPRSASDR